MRFCDLHTHSIYSDGTFTPKEIVDSAIDAGLSAVALCDHNTVDGVCDFLAAAKGKNIEAVAGAEFSVDYNGAELHLLGLFIPEEKLDEVSVIMKDVNDKKDQSNFDLIMSLNKAGYEIDYEEIKKSTPNGKFNRAHIAEVLTRKGYTDSIKQAFDTLLSKKAGYYKEPERLSFWYVLDFIKSIGAVPVLAHPFLNLSQSELEILLPLARDKGLVGMECYYSLYDEAEIQRSILLAEKYNLMCSGGSDFHGDKKPDIKLGIGKGELRIPYDCLEKLKTAQ